MLDHLHAASVRTDGALALLAANGNPPLVSRHAARGHGRPSCDVALAAVDCSRLSAISVAERVAAERVEPIGRTVGYQVSAAPGRMHAAQPSPTRHPLEALRKRAKIRSEQLCSATSVAAAQSAAPTCAS